MKRQRDYEGEGEEEKEANVERKRFMTSQIITDMNRLARERARGLETEPYPSDVSSAPLLHNNSSFLQTLIFPPATMNKWAQEEEEEEEEEKKEGEEEETNLPRGGLPSTSFLYFPDYFHSQEQEASPEGRAEKEYQENYPEEVKKLLRPFAKQNILFNFPEGERKFYQQAFLSSSNDSSDDYFSQQLQNLIHDYTVQHHETGTPREKCHQEIFSINGDCEDDIINIVKLLGYEDRLIPTGTNTKDNNNDIILPFKNAECGIYCLLTNLPAGMSHIVLMNEDEQEDEENRDENFVYFVELDQKVVEFLPLVLNVSITPSYPSVDPSVDLSTSGDDREIKLTFRNDTFQQQQEEKGEEKGEKENINPPKKVELVVVTTDYDNEGRKVKREEKYNILFEDAIDLILYYGPFSYLNFSLGFGRKNIAKFNQDWTFYPSEWKYIEGIISKSGHLFTTVGEKVVRF